MAVLRLSVPLRTTMADQIGLTLDAGPAAGTIQLRTGTMPATPATAATGTLVATVNLADPSTSAAASGVETILDPASVVVATAGDVTWARLLDSTGVAVADCDVSVKTGGTATNGITAGTGTLQLDATNVAAGSNIDFGAITITVPMG